MNRQKLAAYLTETYGIAGEQLFARYPNFLVFRHTGNRKWFAVIAGGYALYLALAVKEESATYQLTK